MRLRKWSPIIATIFLFSFVFMVSTGCVYADDGIQKSINEIAGILGAVAGFVCVGKCIHIGILFLLGTVQDKTKAKEAFVVWFIGAIICAGYLTIGQWLIGVIGAGAGDVLSI